MKNLVIVALMLALGYMGWGYVRSKPMQPMYDQPYLVVFGRDSCGFTQDTVRGLSNAGIKFKYLNVDNKAVATVLHSRMQATGLDTSHYLLPVVDLNNAIQIRPDNTELIARAKALALH